MSDHRAISFRLILPRSPASESGTIAAVSIHWPIVRRLLRCARRDLITDDRRTWKGIELLAGAFHVSAIIEQACSTRTVGLLLPTSGAFPMAALGAWFQGRTVVPLNYLLKPEELQYVVDDCGTDLVIASRALLEHLGQPPRCRRLIILEDVNFKRIPEVRWPRPAAPDDLGVLLYTSGTSGRPKGVMLTHGNITSNIEQSIRAAQFNHRDTLVGVLPQFHSFGFTVLTMLPLTIGARVIYSARFVPNRIMKLIEQHRANALVAIPSMYGAMLSTKNAGPEQFRSIRLAVSGGEPLPDDVATRFHERFGIRLNEGYGLTETAPVTNICLPHDYVRHSVGPPVPGVHERIVDVATERDVAVGEEGEIRISGPNIMQGYYRLPRETAAAFDRHGYFRTGDMGRLDLRGHLFITGRIKEMIIVGGENVFPREIEEVLNRHPAVAASAVIGVMDPVRGELPWAFIELDEGAAFDETELRNWCREHLAGYKVPRGIEHIDALPRNPTGKIMRRELMPSALPKK